MAGTLMRWQIPGKFAEHPRRETPAWQLAVGSAGVCRGSQCCKGSAEPIEGGRQLQGKVAEHAEGTSTLAGISVG